MKEISYLVFTLPLIIRDILPLIFNFSLAQKTLDSCNSSPHCDIGGRGPWLHDDPMCTLHALPFATQNVVWGPPAASAPRGSWWRRRSPGETPAQVTENLHFNKILGWLASLGRAGREPVLFSASHISVAPPATRDGYSTAYGSR